MKTSSIGGTAPKRADAMISENANQGGTNFPSAMDGVATAIRLIAQVFLSDADNLCLYVQRLSASDKAADTIRGNIIKNGEVGRDVIYRYFDQCVTKTLSRKVVQEALASLDNKAQTIVLEEVAASNAHVTAKAEAKRAADELARTDAENAKHASIHATWTHTDHFCNSINTLIALVIYHPRSRCRTSALCWLSTAFPPSHQPHELPMIRTKADAALKRDRIAILKAAEADLREHLKALGRAKTTDAWYARRSIYEAIEGIKFHRATLAKGNRAVDAQAMLA